MDKEGISKEPETMEPAHDKGVGSAGLFCTWVRDPLDFHFDISCVDKTYQRANKEFKSIAGVSKWEFKYCPYCGNEIKISSYRTNRRKEWTWKKLKRI